MSEEKLVQSDNNKLKIAIIGGGLVGSLASLHLAQKGYDIDVYERREDIRKVELVKGKSINLALSTRGRAALAEVGLENELLLHGIPMKGRMLHDINGKNFFSPYDVTSKQCIYSVGRKHLNEILLNSTEKYPNITTYFNHKLISTKFNEGKLTFLNPITLNKTVKYADLIIGCDGAYSEVRRQMLNQPGFNFNQSYIEHGYIELCIPSINGDFAMPPNYLHIWPRGKFMMIALPNQDKSWTVTLFMPFNNFNSLATSVDLIKFFEKYFPDAIPLIGKEKLIEDFYNTKAQALISVKCKPYNLGSNVLLMGDAAHAMVPFYGQGMNAGFEDCLILSNILNEPGISIGEAISKFSEIRWQNAHAICDLAMYNYIEMRDLVTKTSFRMRKIVDKVLYTIIPKTWIPLYNTVSFSQMPYKKCIDNKKWQDKVLLNSTLFFVLGLSATTIVYIYNLFIVKSNN